MATADLQMTDNQVAANRQTASNTEAGRYDRHIPGVDKFMLILLMACFLGMGIMLVSDLVAGLLWR